LKELASNLLPVSRKTQVLKNAAAAVARAEKLFKAQERQTDGKNAMNEYLQYADSIRDRTAKLRAARLDRDGNAPKSLAKKGGAQVKSS
jgi:hypothetical protein